MRVMIDILHPAHVHFYKNVYRQLIDRDHAVLVTARAKDRSTELLDHCGIPYDLISTSTRGAWRQLTEFASRTARFVSLARSFRPDVLTGIMGPTIAVAGKLIGCPAYVFYDTEFAKTTNRFVYPLSTRVVTPDCYQGQVGRNHLTYAGYHELAYLHPNHFTPDPEVVRSLGLDPRERLAVVRFVGWWATHDRHEVGLTRENKIRLVHSLAKTCRVIVSSESPVPNELAEYEYHGRVEQIHHLLAHAHMYYGESATMASECAVLGVPAIYIARTGRGYTDDQAARGLVFNFNEQQFDESFAKAVELASGSQSEVFAAAHQQLLADKIDVARFIVELLESDFGPAGHERPAARAAS